MQAAWTTRISHVSIARTRPYAVVHDSRLERRIIRRFRTFVSPRARKLIIKVNNKSVAIKSQHRRGNPAELVQLDENVSLSSNGQANL
jgi:hypothetical protein